MSAGTSSLVQGCTAFAVDVLIALTCPDSSATTSNSSGQGSPPATATLPAAAALHAAALKVLAATAHVDVSRDSMDCLLQVMQALLKQQDGLALLLASVVGKLRISGDSSRHEVSRSVAASLTLLATISVSVSWQLPCQQMQQI